MKGGIYLAIASILHLECAAQIIQKSMFRTIPSALSSAGNIGIEANGAKDHLHIFREASSSLSSSTGIVKGHRLLSTDTHELVFVVQQKNMVELTQILHDVSDPTSLNYGNHLTRQEVIDLTSNPHSHDEVVAYLTDAGAVVVEEQLSVGLITARGEIGLWERMLNTEFYSYSFRRDPVETKTHDDRKFTRTDKYFVPSCLDGHVASVLNTIDAPVLNMRRMPQSPLRVADITTSSRFSKTSALIQGYVTPQLIANAYDIDDNTGHPRATQAALGGWGNYFCPDDLKLYQNLLGLPIKAVNQSTGSRSTEWCLESGDKCAEGNLDIQTMMGIADTPTTYFYTSLGTMGMILASLVARDTPPPLVLSISYGLEETMFSNDEKNVFNENAIKLGAMGVTIVAASGDDGASSHLARDYFFGSSKCGYISMYPACSPYVLAAGGTQVCLRPRRRPSFSILTSYSNIRSTCRVSRKTCRRLCVSMTGEEASPVGAASPLSTRDRPGRKTRRETISLKWLAVTVRLTRDTRLAAATPTCQHQLSVT